MVRTLPPVSAALHARAMYVCRQRVRGCTFLEPAPLIHFPTVTTPTLRMGMYRSMWMGRIAARKIRCVEVKLLIRHHISALRTVPVLSRTLRVSKAAFHPLLMFRSYRQLQSLLLPPV